MSGCRWDTLSVAVCGGVSGSVSVLKIVVVWEVVCGCGAL